MDTGLPTDDNADGSTGEEQEEKYKKVVAGRVFATEFNDAVVQETDADDPRGTVFTVFPTGARTNRVFLTGFPLEVLNEEGDYRVTISDGSPDVFYVYTGEYTTQQVKQQIAKIPERRENRMVLGIVGKVTVTESDDRTYTSVIPEAVNTVSQGTRDRWVIRTADQTLARCDKLGEKGPASINEAYAGRSTEKYRQAAIDVLERMKD